MKDLNRPPLWRDPGVHIFLLVLSLVGFKLFGLEVVSRTYMDCQWCLSTKAVTHESKLILVLLAVHLLSCIFRLRSVRVTLRLVLVLGLVITGLDLLVTHTLWTRLTLSELMAFAGEFGAVSGFLQQLLPNLWTLVALALATGLVLLVFVRYLRDDRPSLPPLYLYLLIGAGLVGCELVESKEYHDAVLQNSVQVFFNRKTANVPYSAEFTKTLATAPAAEPASCNKAVAARSDVILVVFESLSIYHSALFSGINNWMPEFDAISRTGVRFTNFYANGVTSEQGLVASPAVWPQVSLTTLKSSRSR